MESESYGYFYMTERRVENQPDLGSLIIKDTRNYFKISSQVPLSLNAGQV